MSLSIVVNGGGTFTASMEEGPVSFTASLAAVGPKGDTGAAGAAGQGVPVGGTTGQVLAKASGTNYDTEWVARNPFDQDLNNSSNVVFGQVIVTDSTDYFTINPVGITFPDSTEQYTALPSGTADGNIVSWDADTSTYLSVPNDARTLFITARNITGTTIPKGSVVLITGASGNRPTIGLAQGDTSANADGVIGITDAAINNNANGRVITEGLADNLDTSAFAAGDKLYLSSTTPGGLVNVRPVQPAHSVAVGVVTRSNPAVGSIEVRVQVGEHLEFLHDVLLTSNTNLDLLSYETSSGLWKNKSFSTLGLLTSATAASTYLTTSTAASTYAPIASPTFTGTVTIPAGASISGFAPLASPVFTGVPEAPTAAATTNTTQIATTAFVQQEVPAASTSAAGKVELATSAETDAKSSSTLAVTPSGLMDYVNAPQWAIPDISGSTAVVATGTTTIGSAGVRLALATSGSALGQHAARYFGNSSNATVPNFLMRGVAHSSLAKRILLAARVRLSTTANAVHRLTFGKESSGAVGDLSAQGFGLRVNGTGAVELQVHDGTNLANVTSSFTPTSAISFDAVIESVGNGTVNLYINDSLVATSSAGGTAGYTSSTIPTIWMETELTGAITSAAQFMTNTIYLGTVS